MVLAPTDPGRVRRGRPGALGVHRPGPGQAARCGGQKARFDELAADPGFVERLGDAERDLAAYLSEDRWYQRRVQDGPRAIGYFSPEFGITAVLPQYSGGLGILAGDHLKAASDLGVPIVGVGLLYRHGYFKQALSPRGLAAGELPGPRPRRAADLAAARARRHPGHRLHRPARRAAAGRPDLGGAGRPGARC